MRVPMMTILVLSTALAGSPLLFAQTNDATSEEPKVGEQAQPVQAGDEKQEAAPGTPLQPGMEGDLMPLVPPAAGEAGELPPPPPGFQEVTLDEATAAKPPLNVIDLHGYLRLRMDLIDNGDLGQSPRVYPVPSDRGVSYPQFWSSSAGAHDTMAGANMRFRLEPTINISEDVRIMGQIDMLDNLVLGSTPDGFPSNKYTPLVVFSQGQNPAMRGFNSVKDSILVKRLWGEVMIPEIGMLRFGRMPSHWGLGLLANDGGPSFMDRGPLVTQPDPLGLTGQCFDCDYGTTVDRLQFITKIAGHYIVPMLDFTSEGPYSSFPNELSGQPLDLEQLDDVHSWLLAAFKRDKPEDIRNALEKDEAVLNYGIYFMFRNQALDAVDYNTAGDATAGPAEKVTRYAVRNAEIYVPDIWVRLLWRKLRVEMEALMVAGKIGHTNINSTLDSEGHLVRELAERQVDLLQFGGVIQADYSWFNDSLIGGLELGFASGDNSPGMGVRPFEEKQFSNAARDYDINNFRFNQDYHVDLLLWRQIIGTVTDAIYVKPSVQYNIAEGMGAKLSAVYSSAVYADSTRGKSKPLGLELDFDFFYFSDDKFHMGFSYGLLIPLAGMDDLGDDMLPGGNPPDANKDTEATVAHRLMARLVLYF